MERGELRFHVHDIQISPCLEKDLTHLPFSVAGSKAKEWFLACGTVYVNECRPQQ